MPDVYGVFNTAFQIEQGETAEKQFDPVVSVTVEPSQDTGGAQEVSFTVTVSDENLQTCKLQVEYSTSASGPWSDCTLTGTPVVGYGSTPDLDNLQTYQIGTSTPIETDSGDNTVASVWDAGADVSAEATYYLRFSVQDSNGDTATPAVSAGFSVDTVSPVNSNVTLEVTPVSGDTTVSVSADWTESNPDLNFIRIKLNGAAAVETAAPTNTTDTGTVLGNVGSTLYGDDYVQIGARHSDDYGNATTTDSGTQIWVKPAAPDTPTVAVTGKTTVNVTCDDNDADAAGISGSFEHAIRITGGTTGWIQADGSVGGSEIWQTVAAWGTIGVIGLTAKTTYQFATKTRNPNNAATESDLSSTEEVTTISLDPIVQNVSVTVPTDGTGVYTIDAELQDDNTNISIVLEYWDGDSWEATSFVEGDVGPFEDVPASPDVKSITLEWTALSQFGVDGVNLAAAKVRITASDGVNTGSAESSTFALDTTLPAFGTDCIFTVTNTTLTSWTASWTEIASDDRFSTYRLYFSEISFADAVAGNGIVWDSGDDANLGTAATQTTTVTGLTGGTEYFVALTAVDDLGNASSDIIVDSVTTSINAQLHVKAVDVNGYLIPGATVYVYDQLSAQLVTTDTTDSDGHAYIQVLDLEPKFVLVMKTGYGSYVLDDQTPTLVA